MSKPSSDYREERPARDAEVADTYSDPEQRMETPTPTPQPMTSANVDRKARSAAAKKFADQYVRDCEKDGDVLYKR